MSEVGKYGARCDCGAVYTGQDGEKWLAAHVETEHKTPENLQEKFAMLSTETALVGWNSDPQKTSFTLDEVSGLLKQQRELIASAVRGATVA